MHLLAVFCHPRRRSFTGALLDSFASGVREAGHEVELADLYSEGFDPSFRVEDYAQFQSELMPREILAEQRRVDRADALAFVFPVWWWSFPAMLKGWIDRVWSEGWAYNFTPERSKGLLRDRPTIQRRTLAADSARIVQEVGGAVALPGTRVANDLMGTTWMWTGITTPAETRTLDTPANYTVRFD